MQWRLPVIVILGIGIGSILDQQFDHWQRTIPTCLMEWCLSLLGFDIDVGIILD